MKRVLITGASSGIGKEFAYSFASRGFDLVLLSRSKEELENLKQTLERDYSVDVAIIVCDLSKPGSGQAVYDYCHKNNLEVAVLVNNAGYGDYNEFLYADIEKLEGIIELNNRALVALTYYFVKDMKENKYGHIINVGSVASFMPGPYMAVYYASKAFVLSLSMSLREELKPYNIHVSTLCPGPTKSPFWDRAGGKAMQENIFARTSKQAAETGYKLYENNKAYSIDGLFYKTMITILRHLPLETSSKIMAFVQKGAKGQMKKAEEKVVQ